MIYWDIFELKISLSCLQRHLSEYTAQIHFTISVVHYNAENISCIIRILLWNNSADIYVCSRYRDDKNIANSITHSGLTTRGTQTCTSRIFFPVLVWQVLFMWLPKNIIKQDGDPRSTYSLHTHPYVIYTTSQHIKAETKWPLFCRRHCHVYLRVWNFHIFIHI